MPSLPPTQASGFNWIVLSDDPRGLGLGGPVIPLEAAAALNVGDAVFISAANRVNKGVTVADHRRRCGVVVGGLRTDFVCGLAVGTPAATAAGDIVLVAVAPAVVECIAGAAIAAGDVLKYSTAVAGRVIAGSTPLTIASGAVAVTSTAASGDIISGDGENSILGMALAPAAAAGDAVKVLLTFS